MVDNVKVTCVGSNVSVSWNGIPLIGNFGDDENDQYRVRIIDTATSEFLRESGKIDINSTDNYVYNADLSEYIGKDLWIRIEAREEIGDLGLVNRSSYNASCSPVPESTTMLLLGAGILALAGFGRKKFKK